jgi:hypothetical protein
VPVADSFDIDGSDFVKLAEELGKAAIEVDRAAYRETKAAAKTLEEKWRANAKESAGRHGKHYPRAITSEQMPATGEAWWQVGPESDRKQGDMSFEYGSRNQPPHLDMTREIPGIEQAMFEALDKAVRDLL